MITDGEKDIVGHVGISLPAGFCAGGTFYTGKDGLADPDDPPGRSGFGADVGFVKDKIWVMGEYIASTEEQVGGADDLKKAGFHVCDIQSYKGH